MHLLRMPSRGWPYAVLLLFFWTAAAAAAPVIDHAADQLPVPFRLSWLTIGVFSFLGGICSMFVKLDIDKHFWTVPLAKFVMGTSAGMAGAILWIGALAPEPFEAALDLPPPISAACIAWATGLCGAPIAQTFMRFLSDSSNTTPLIVTLIRLIPGFGNYKKGSADTETPK